MIPIKAQIIKGAKWSSFSTIIITITQIIQFLLLGKSLTVQEFGMVGMFTMMIIFSQIILDLGIGSAVIQKEQLSNRQLSTLFWMNIFLGIFLFVALQLGSPLIASFFHEMELINGIRLLAWLFLMAPIGQQAQYLLQKELRFQTIGKIETISVLISFLLLFVFLFKSSVEPIIAYVASQVILYSLKGFLYYVCYRKIWKPALIFDLSCCKEIFSFGVYQLLSRLVNRIGGNLDVILIGKFMGMEALGIYSLVSQIVTIPVLKINPIITRVAFPVFSKVQHDNAQLTEGFIYMTKMIAFITFPLLIGLLALSDLLIALMFGKEWMNAVPILKIMLVVGILRVLMNPNGSIILAKGKANLAFYWDAIFMVIYGIALFLAVLSEHLIVVAWTYAAVSLINFILGRWLLERLINLKWTIYMKSIFTPFLLAIFITLVAFFIKTITSFYLSNAIVLSLAIAISAIVYFLLLKSFLPNKKGTSF
ncbi:MOP flippase family protein [Niallia sp. NCCP-28]|uniref:teichuronic acid biosynthesis protein TuaB n=1 Tax=Niallia sp. NCCP-28 TaxID=2934712 RepID=UPI00208D2063|nr:MOP flippase family protein [Niallia sp. NCCP-28]GKU84553.1 teichuronic acid biosynthesis protein TuaB [Niallia sp. NCCP-28]